MPHIENRISLGNILTVLALAVPAIMAFATMNAQASQSAAQIADHEARLRVIETTISENLARIDERLGSIEAKLAGVKR